MAIEYKLPFTASEIDAKLNLIGGLSAKVEEIKEQIAGGTGGVSSWNDLTDKPFEEFPRAFDIQWDGDFGDRFALDLSPLGYGNTWFVKVSDEVFTAEQLIGATYTQTSGYECTLETHDIDNATYPGALSIGGIIVAYDSDVLNAALGLPAGYITNGVYFVYINDGDGAWYTDRLVAPVNIKKLDPKFLPEGIGYELPPKFDITWDGSMDGRVVLDMSLLGYDAGTYFVKVSDDVFTADEVIDGRFYIRFENGSIDYLDVNMWNIDTTTYTGAFTLNDYIVIVRDSNALASALGIPTGIYTNGVYFWLVTGNGYVNRFVGATEIVKIDKKFIDMPDIDLSNYVTKSNVQTMINNAIGNAIGGEY